MPLDIPWYRVNRLTDLLSDVTWATEQEALDIAVTISDMIIDVGQQALDDATAHADSIKVSVTADIDAKIAGVMTYIDLETDLIYSQLDIWLDDVEVWITALITDVTESIGENTGFTEESIEGIGTVIYEGVNTSVEETGSWIGGVYDNVKTTIWDSTSNLVDRLAGLVEMIKEAPQIIINKMATELVPAEAGQWLMTAGNVLTGMDMNIWLDRFKGKITEAGDEFLTFDVDEVTKSFIDSFKEIKDKLPELVT